MQQLTDKNPYSNIFNCTDNFFFNLNQDSDDSKDNHDLDKFLSRTEASNNLEKARHIFNKNVATACSETYQIPESLRKKIKIPIRSASINQPAETIPILAPQTKKQNPLHEKILQLLAANTHKGTNSEKTDNHNPLPNSVTINIQQAQTCTTHSPNSKMVTIQHDKNKGEDISALNNADNTSHHTATHTTNMNPSINRENTNSTTQEPMFTNLVTNNPSSPHREPISVPEDYPNTTPITDTRRNTIFPSTAPQRDTLHHSEFETPKQPVLKRIPQRKWCIQLTLQLEHSTSQAPDRIF